MASFLLPNCLFREWLSCGRGYAISFASLVSSLPPGPFSSPIKLVFYKNSRFVLILFFLFSPHCEKLVRGASEQPCGCLAAGWGHTLVRRWGALFLYCALTEPTWHFKKKNNNLTAVFAFTSTTQTCNRYYRQKRTFLDFVYPVQESFNIQFCTVVGALSLYMHLLYNPET